jgi:hypothetical protein
MAMNEQEVITTISAKNKSDPGGDYIRIHRYTR